MNAKLVNEVAGGPFRREDLPAGDLPWDQIKGLYISERFSAEEAIAKCREGTKEQYPHGEVFGSYCNVNEYIRCPIDVAYRYMANVYSLEEWTFSVRELKHLGDGLYVGREALAPDTMIYARTECHPESRVVDYLCAWDQGQELWMRYYCRLVDAQPTLKKPGCVLMWLNCKHPYYDRSSPAVPAHLQASLSRKDRPWVGDVWDLFYAAHLIEAQNLKVILEQRFGHLLDEQGSARGQHAARRA